MRVLHVTVEQGDSFLVAQGLEEPGIITQAKTLDELLANVRDAAELLLNETDLQIELIIPSTAASKKASKISKPKKPWKTATRTSSR